MMKKRGAKNKLVYSFEDDLRFRLKQPEFKKVWQESEPEYLLARQLIQKRLEEKISQRSLAKKVKTSQAVISRLETMTANPSLSLLKRVARALDSRLVLQLK